jgi:hypothetical protein
MHWTPEPLWRFFEAQGIAPQTMQPDPLAAPPPAPKRPVPTDPKALRGLDIMKGLFAQANRGHFRHHTRR